MSQANLEKFYEVATKNPAMIEKLTSGVQSPQELINRLVALGGEQGLAFDAAETEAWINEQRKMKADGELSDFQLQGVAGGKAQFVKKAEQEIESTANDVGDWFASW